MERFAGQDLQAGQVNLVPAVKLEVFFRKIVAHDADEFDRAEKARGHGGMAGRTAQQARIFRFGSLDGIQRGGTDNKNAHVFRVWDLGVWVRESAAALALLDEFDFVTFRRINEGKG